MEEKNQRNMGAESFLNSESFVSSTFPRRPRDQKVVGSLIRWIRRVRASGFLTGSKMAKSRYLKLHCRRGSKVKIVLAMLFTLTVLLLTMMDLGIVDFPKTSLGSSSPIELSSFRHKASQSGDGLGERGEQWVQVLSPSEPRAFLYHNFLSKEECEYLIAQATPYLKKSTVVDSKTGRSKDSRVRTSTGMFLKRGQDEIVRAIEKRIAEFTFIPIEHGESIQVLHYDVGQQYVPHFDYFLDEFNVKYGGQRIATVLMYLSDVEEGGETVFPAAARGNISSNEVSECGREGLAVKPKMGNALLFWSMHPDATVDPTSLHGSCPVIRGSKWSATKWMRVYER